MHLEMLNTVGNNVKAATQVVRTMTLLTRSFEAEVDPEVKSAFREVSSTTLEILRTHSDSVIIRDAVVLYFHRMIIVMGIDVLPLLKDLINVLIQNYDIVVLCAVIKIATLALVSWKQMALGFISELSSFLLNSILTVGFPFSKITDMERVAFEAIYNYEKLLKTIILIDPNAIFKESADSFTTLMEYLAKWAQSKNDEMLRRLAISLLMMLFGFSLGLIITGENPLSMLDQPINQAKALAFVNNKPIHARVLLQRAEECAIGPLNILDPYQQIDLQSISDLAVLHSLLYKEVGKLFIDKLELWIRENELQDCTRISEALDQAQNSHGIKTYKDIVKHMLIKKLKKG